MAASIGIGDVGVGTDTEPVDVLAEIEVAVLGADDRVNGFPIARDRRTATISGSGFVFVYWWASGWSGTVIPTIAPISGPQMPAAHTTMSASISPSSVTTARTRPSSVRMPGHGVAAEEAGAALGRAAGLRLGHADGLGEPVGRDVVGAEDRVAVDERPEPGRLVGVDHPAVDAPRLGEPLRADGARAVDPRSARARGCRPG